MKKYIPFLLLTMVLSLAFTVSSDKNELQLVNNVVVQFEGINGNGNNVWLDNFSIGTRYNNDLAVASMDIKDMNYLKPGVTSATVSPVVTVFNTGRSASAATTITMVAGAYNVTKDVGSITGGLTSQITFDPITFDLNVSRNVKVYLNWTADQNKNNDTLNQSTIYYPGVQRKVLFEAHTSTTCGPCASQNPSLDAFIQQRFDSIVPIKTHVWWPALGDPMYGLNIPQARIRTLYNSVSAVPTLQIDGILQQISGYTTPANLMNPYSARLSKASPIAISVTDTRLAGDTIKATININVVSPVSSGSNLKLKIVANERKITYATPPGSNGETIFHDVFRRMYPTTNGISINTSPGNYVYEYKYKKEATWIDSMIYTAVFIQDENTHEVINCAKARNYYLDGKVTENSMPVSLNNNPSILTPTYSPLFVTGGISVDNMEYAVPPAGWSLFNSDLNFTFWQYTYSAVNGPSFGGAKSIRISYYSYTDSVGTSDKLTSKVYNNVSPDDSIKFDWAHANRTGYNDRLIVRVSTDGGTTFPYTIFDRSGATLATAGSSSSSFVPTAAQWGTFGARFGSLTGINPGGNETPAKYELSQNYPNPFNPSTTISFAIPVKGFVKLVVYDLLGKEISTLINSEMTAGNHKVEFNSSNLPSGVYFYKIEVNGFTDVRKMLLLK